MPTNSCFVCAQWEYDESLDWSPCPEVFNDAGFEVWNTHIRLCVHMYKLMYVYAF